ncbi:CC_3452 family protein [Aurantiacibacter sediminis]|uniref:Uncharacterized protein n=1 Tax=Aurantiacibacter sediminis TaxID=2793064 RepID=A0ABS0MZB4_9SPHN|nr:hypothetical protein [Aurantiacibacter sediminis]MBH5321058.1 hypothetical protein [Aurantiacibacter sediminis]
MKRFAAAALSAILPLAALAAPAATQATGTSQHYFEATLLAPTEEETAIAGGVVFRCDGESCTGPRSGDRPLRVCSDLRRDVGQIASFKVRGELMSDAMLARCNG